MPAKGNGSSAMDASRWDGLKGSTNGEPMSYSAVGGELLRDAVVTVTDCGDAILFGRTGDGGALSVQILHNKKATKFYPSDASELMELLQGIISA